MSELSNIGNTATNEEAFRVSTTLALSSGFILPTLQSVLTFAVHEILNNEKKEVIAIAQ